MTLQKPLKAMIIGCGSIGALKPNNFDAPHGRNVLTHAHAYTVSPDVQLVGVVDTDEDKAKHAAKKWNCRCNTDYLEAMKDWEPDIVSVCTPTSTHLDVLCKLSRYKHDNKGCPLRLIIAEKPFCLTRHEARSAYANCKAAGVDILVNYSRRFSVDYQQFQQVINSGKCGQVYHARLLYGRGLLRDGCHGLDLFNWFLGAPMGVQVISGMHDYQPEDPTLDLTMAFVRCNNVQLVGVDSKNYGVFEMDFVTQHGRYVLAENGSWLHTYEPREEPTYGNYKSLPGRPQDSKKTDLTNMLARMVANAANHLLTQEPLLCSATDALQVHEIIHRANHVYLSLKESQNATGH